MLENGQRMELKFEGECCAFDMCIKNKHTACRRPAAYWFKPFELGLRCVSECRATKLPGGF